MGIIGDLLFNKVFTDSFPSFLSLLVFLISASRVPAQNRHEWSRIAYLEEIPVHEILALQVLCQC